MRHIVTGLPDHETRRLLQLVTGLDAAGVALLDALEPGQQLRFDELVERRLSGEPLQYLEGFVEFGPVTVKVDSRALIPRPETEVLWELAAAALSEAGPETVIVDMCTGSGNLALAFRHAFPNAKVFATDLDDDALSLARENLAGEAVEVLQGDLFGALPNALIGKVDLLVANPPYVSEEAVIPAEVHDHEPHGALYAGAHGDEVLQLLAAGAPTWVKPGGWLFVEIGEDQAERALEMFEGFDCTIENDLTDRPRILAGRRLGP